MRTLRTQTLWTQTVQMQMLQKQIDSVKATARLLAEDIVDYMSRSSSTSLRCRHASTLRRTVDELSSRHRIVFLSIARKLDSDRPPGESSTDLWRHSFVAVVDGLFADRRYNWGRVVTVYAFAGWLARQHCDKSAVSGDEVSRTIATAAGEYVADKLSPWICEQGGWVCCLLTFLSVFSS
jgi:hypothetical protein